MPAMDTLNLAQNEGEDHTGDLDLAFVGVLHILVPPFIRLISHPLGSFRGCSKCYAHGELSTIELPGQGAHRDQ